MCTLVCECGYHACPTDRGYAAGELDYSRCYAHDPVLAIGDDDCLSDVACCIPSSECPIMCTVNQQAEINMLMLALVDATLTMADEDEGDHCETLFALQLHGIAQDEYELCICIKKAIQEIDAGIDIDHPVFPLAGQGIFGHVDAVPVVDFFDNVVRDQSKPIGAGYEPGLANP